MSGGLHWSLGEGVPENLLAHTAEVAPPAPGGAEAPTPGALVPGGYRIEAVLGQGTSGTVFRARQEATGRDVAIKLLSSGCDPILRERLVREGQLAAALDHPGIGRVFSAGEWGGQPFLVYELLEGCRPLEEVFDALPREDALRVILEVADALGHAHRQGVLHRDVKPDNVLLDGEGRARVIDFGHGRGAEQVRLTQTGALIGTPLYMAPECFDSSGVGPAADVWALGVMLFRALSGGRFPFFGQSLAELAEQVWKGDPGSLRISDSSVTPSLEVVYQRALAPRPADRYPHAAAFAVDLRRALAGEVISAPRRQRAALVLGSLSLVLASAAVCTWWLASTSPRPVSESSGPFSASAEDLQGDPRGVRAAGERWLEVHPGDQDARAVVADAALRLGDRAGAEVHLRRLRASPERAVLEARAAAQEGGDLAERLAKAQAAWPDAPAPTLAWVDHLATRARFQDALAACEASPARWVEVRARADLLEELLSDAPSAEALAATPPSWREHAGAWLLRVGARDLELAERLGEGNPWVRTGPERALADFWRMPLGLEDAARRRRAEARLRGSLPLLSGASRTSAEAHLQRLGRGPPTAAALPAAREKAAGILVSASGRGGAGERNPGGRPLVEHLEDALTLDPGFAPASYFLGRERFRGGETRALREAVQAARDCPRMMRHLNFDLRLWAVENEGGLRKLWDAWELEDDLDRITRLVIGVASLEFEGTSEGLLGQSRADADRCLAKDPADLISRTLRGFVELRMGDLDQAREDLDVVREAIALAPQAEFYGALLLMRREAKAEEVVAALARAKRQGYVAWDGDPRGLLPALYPEASGYLVLPALRGYFREAGDY